MANRTDLEYNVRWLPFQLNDQAAPQSNKLEMYMKKFGMSKSDAMAKGEWMKQRFQAVGLPFRFTETDLTGNTFDAHRVMTKAYEEGGPAAQDKAAEVLFHSYFAEGKAPSDPAVLEAAANAAGLDGAALVADPSIGASKTNEEFSKAQQFRVSGVPHFVIYDENKQSGRPAELSGAQPPEQFLEVLKQVTRS